MAVFDERKTLSPRQKNINLLAVDKAINNTHENNKLKFWLILLHLSPIIGFFIGFLGIQFCLFFILPTMIVLYKNQSVTVVQNYFALLNFLISWSLYSFILAALFVFLSLKSKSLIYLTFTLILPITGSFFCLLSSWRIYQNKKIFYPLSFKIFSSKFNTKKGIKK